MMSSLQQIISRQVGKWNVERKIYNKSREEGKEVIHPAAAKPIVTVSRQRGALGCQLTKTLAESLNYGFIDKAITEEIAKDKGIHNDLVEMLDEHDRSVLEVWVRSLLSEHVFDYDDYIHELSKILKTIALQGGVVILGRGANFILHSTHAFHIRVVANKAIRVQNVMKQDGLSEEEAWREIDTVDKERAHLVWRYFHRDIEDPTTYDMILNMENTTVEGAVKIVLTALRARGWSMELTGGDKRLRRAG